MLSVRLPILGLAIMIGGCSAMSEQECLVSDWHAVGFEDGARGYPVEQIAQYRKSCADYGVAPDLAQYQAGRQSGLVEYCQPDRAFQIGSTGAGSHGSADSTLSIISPETLGAVLLCAGSVRPGSPSSSSSPRPVSLASTATPACSAGATRGSKAASRTSSTDGAACAAEATSS